MDGQDRSENPRDQKISYVQSPDRLSVSEILERFSTENNEKVQFLRPFSAFSASSFSTPMTLSIGQAYLAAVLEKAGYAVDVIDAVSEGIELVRLSECKRFKFQGLSKEQILDRIHSDTKVLAISLLFSQEWVHQRELINFIKKNRPEIIIIVGGEHATAMPEYVLNDCLSVDFLITGEGEFALLELLHNLFNNHSIEGKPGLWHRDPMGQIVGGGLSARILDFANLPRPAWHLFQIEDVLNSNFSMGINSGRNMIILASRGCPFQCTFCSNPTMWTPRYLTRPPSEVVDEIEWLIEEYGATGLDFADLTAIVKKEWVLEFCRELKERNIDIGWQLPSGTRSEALDEETVKAIYDAGCKFLVYAPESGSAETLKIIKKKLNLGKLINSVRYAVKVGHTVKVNLIVGLPEETRREMLKTIWFSVRMAFIGIDDCGITIFAPYPGSQLFDDLYKDGVISEINDDYFNGLLAQYDIAATTTYCRHVPSREVAFYRILGMGLFYGITYLVRPVRLLQLILNIRKKDFMARSLFEQRLHDMLLRRQLQE